MGDEAEIINSSAGDEKKLPEDRIEVVEKELLECDDARDNEEEVFEEAFGSQLYEDFPLQTTPEKSKADHEAGDSDQTSSNKKDVNGLSVNYSVIGESPGEVYVPQITLEDAELDFVTPRINDDRLEAGAEIFYGQLHLSLDEIEKSAKVTSNGSNLAVEDVNMENGNSHSFSENGIVSPENKKLAKVISISVWPEEKGNDGVEDKNWEEKVGVSAVMQTEQEFGGGEESNKNCSEKKGLECTENESVSQRNDETGLDYDNGKNASADNCLNGSIEVVDVEASSPFEKSSFEEKVETEGHSSSSGIPGVSSREHETVQNSNGVHDVHRSPQPSKELEKQQSSRVNIGQEITESPYVGRESEVGSSFSPTESRSSTAALPPARPAGLGRAAPLLEPAPRVTQQHRDNGNVSHNQPQVNGNVSHNQPQVNGNVSHNQPQLNGNVSHNQPQVNGNVSHNQPQVNDNVSHNQPQVNGNVSLNQPQQAEDATTAETDEYDETREKLQLIRVKFLRLAHRLGQTPHNVVVAQVLYRLGLAEQLRCRNGSRVGAFSFDLASAMAEQLEAAGQDPLDLSCTIMVLGKSGVGKSATINSIFDEVRISTDAFQMGTKRVQSVEGFLQGIQVRVIDTPGLLPSWSDQHKNEKTLRSVRDFIKKNPPDIVLYLDRLDMQSRNSGDMPLMRTITNVFGPSIWFNAIVGLTHAASAPPDGPNGTASSYETFVAQRSNVIQQAIQAVGDIRLMNPVSLVENHSACRTNRAGQRVLPNGQVWKPHLLLLSFASKILADANALLKLQDNSPGRPLAARSKAPPLPFLLSSLLQSRPQAKLPEQQYGDEEDEDDLESSDSDEDSEYDQLPPFKRLTKAEMAKLSKYQKKEYLNELEYREKLFMKRQMKEERKRRKMLKKFTAETKDLPNGYSENVEEERSEPASVPVPMPDLPLPASFDSDNPTHRYRSLDSSNQWLVRPVLETQGWDHDVGYESVNAERLFVVKEKIPISFSAQVTKDKKDANVQLEMASSVRHGEARSTSLGFDMQNAGKEMAYTLRSETRFNNFWKNKTAAGLSVTLLGDSVSAGLKVEDKLIAFKRLRMVMSGGAMTSRGDVAYGGSLEAQWRDKDYPLGRFLSSLGFSVMDWHGDLAIGGNIQSQVPIGRSSNLIARANVNNRGAGQVSIRVNSSEQLQLAMVALVPLFKKLLGYYSPQQMQY